MYGLFHNGKIRVGPRDWSYSFFKYYLENNNLDYSQVPVNDPLSSIIQTDFKILRVSELITPLHDQLFEQLAGPYWTINENDITGYYDVVDSDIDLIKSHMREIVAANRYEVEIGGIDFTFPDNTVVGVYTSRDDRSVYLDALLVMGDTDTIDFKFKNNIFKTTTKLDLQGIVGSGSQHIKEVFSWESAKCDEINSAQDIAALKIIELRHQIQIDNGAGG